jgi:hypothetical protein
MTGAIKLRTKIMKHVDAIVDKNIFEAASSGNFISILHPSALRYKVRYCDDGVFITYEEMYGQKRTDTCSSKE